MDRITHLSYMWDALAPSDLPRSKVLGGWIEFFITDETTRQCFAILLQRVREQSHAIRTSTLRGGRTDPWTMQVTLVPFGSGEIEIRWKLDACPPSRGFARVLDEPLHDENFLHMCSWCRDVRTGDGWEHLDAAAQSLKLLERSRLPPITHGICPACAEKVVPGISGLCSQSSAV